MKKCKGCGVTLQINEENKMGYAKSLEQDYCQRCFRLTHYGDFNKLNLENVTNEDVYKVYDQYKDDVFVLIVEAFDGLILDLDYLLDIYAEKKLIVVINKIDLLPINVKDEKIEELFIKAIKKSKAKNIINCLITYNKDPYFNDLFFETLKECDSKRFIFAGRVNAGKSSIINKLLQDNSLTVSAYPGTTITSNIIEVNDLEFIDTPGLIDYESFVNNIDKTLIKDLIPLKTIKSRVFQCYEPQNYSIEGLLSVDIIPLKNASIQFYINNELDIHRTKSENANNYLNRHENEFKLKVLPFKPNEYKVYDTKMFYIKGLGYFKVNGKANISINVNSNIKIYECEVDL